MRGQPKSAVQYAALAKRVLSRYPKEKLRTALEAYDYDRFDFGPDDTEYWTAFHQQRCMSVEELKNLSGWKTGGRQERNIQANSTQAVNEVTRAALVVDSEVPNEPSLSIGILRTLFGVDIPTASTVMTVWDPERFAILDIRAWRALGRAAKDEFRPLESTSGHRRPFRLQDATTYLLVIRELAGHTSLTCREIDKALWQLDKKQAEDD